MPKIIAITQARCSSTRLPNKVFASLGDTTVLQLHIDRIKHAKLVDELIIATTTNVADDSIETFAKENGIPFYRGSEENVLSRFYFAVKDRYPDYVIRVTSDCPLIDPSLIDELIQYTISNDFDYVSNTFVESFPDGQDIEVLKFAALEYSYKHALKKYEQEHVTPFIKENSDYNNQSLFKVSNYASPDEQYGKVRMTIDQKEDLNVLNELVNKLGKKATWKEYADYYLKNQKLAEKNNFIVRNEGFLKSKQNEQ